MEKATVIPAVNQIEIYPLFTQEPLRNYCKEKGIQIMAYSPLGRMHDVLMKSKILREMVEKYKKTVPQIILRWNLDSGLAIIPRTLSIEHFTEIMDILNFTLTNEDIKAIDAVNENIRLHFNPDTVDYSIV